MSQITGKITEFTGVVIEKKKSSESNQSIGARRK
jgi:hypothetical protein